MSKKNPQIDAYISKSASFSKPVLKHFRELVHSTCPEAEEKIKWGFPHFDYKGNMMCSMAAFKAHCAISFWKASLMKDADKMKANNNEAMGHYNRITCLEDLPTDKKIIANIKEAMKLNEEGVKLAPRKNTIASLTVIVPSELKSALLRNKKAKETFENFSPSHRKEYVEWITEAKTKETRDKRVDTTIKWLTDGRSRNWKYSKNNN